MALLTARAAAERMGVGYSTLKQWIRLGKIRTTHTAGGHHRLSESEVDRILAQHTPPASATRAADRSTGMIVTLSGRNQLREVMIAREAEQPELPATRRRRKK
jgi:excisionase family DNA binding protein